MPREALASQLAVLADHAVALFRSEHGHGAERDHAHRIPWSLAQAFGLEVRLLAVDDEGGVRVELLDRTIAVWSALGDADRGDAVLWGVAEYLLRSHAYEEHGATVAELAERIGGRLGWRVGWRASRRRPPVRGRTGVPRAA